jgi:hypothetical protein
VPLIVVHLVAAIRVENHRSNHFLKHLHHRRFHFAILDKHFLAMRISSMRPFFLLSLSLLLLANLSTAEENQSDEDAAYEEAVQNQSQEDSSFNVCSNAVIEVEAISILCDSPGSYYYGSSKYRNSDTCTAGDKAKIQLDIYIADPDAIYAAGASLITIGVQGYGNSADQIVYQDADLCSLSSLKALDGTSCPAQGQYRITTQFYWTGSSSSSNDIWIPTVSVGFKSNLDKSVYDLGGANTNKCSGNIWSDAVKNTYDSAVANLMKTFGILALTVTAMGGFVCYIARRRRMALPTGKEHLIVEEEPNNWQMVSSSKDVLDF